MTANDTTWFYAVAKGRNVGVYDNWEKCFDQTGGFDGCEFDRFPKKAEAEKYIEFCTCEVVDLNNNQNVLEPIKHAVVYTDGACKNNGEEDAVGGIGIFWGEDHENNVSRRLTDKPVTNNRAEYIAAIEAIKQALRDGYDKVTIKTDSDLLFKSINWWHKKWIRNGWKTVKHEDVRNQDLLKEILSLRQIISVKIEKVPGHSGVHGNMQADKLAKAAIDDDVCEEEKEKKEEEKQKPVRTYQTLLYMQQLFCYGIRNFFKIVSTKASRFWKKVQKTFSLFFETEVDIPPFFFEQDT